MAMVKKERGRGGIVRWLTDGIVMLTSVGFGVRERSFQQMYRRVRAFPPRAIVARLGCVPTWATLVVHKHAR